MEVVQSDVSRAYANISSNGENQIGIFKPNVLQSLFILASSVEEKCGNMRPWQLETLQL